MSTHRETGEIEGPFATGDPVSRLLEFYLANGYRIVERQAETGDDAAPLTSLRVERGRAGAGWWTSNMTELHTEVEVERDGDTVHVSYTIDTSGQLLNEIEEGFWGREINSARRYACNDSGEPRDLRKEEARRAEHQNDELMSIGLWGAIGVSIVIVVLGFFGFI